MRVQAPRLMEAAHRFRSDSLARGMVEQRGAVAAMQLKKDEAEAAAATARADVERMGRERAREEREAKTFKARCEAVEREAREKMAAARRHSHATALMRKAVVALSFSLKEPVILAAAQAPQP